MANNWKYASLGERERLKKISEGDKDVYSTEKARNKELKRLQTELGLSTAKTDNWESKIDSAYKSAIGAQLVPNFTATSKNYSSIKKALDGYNNEMSYLTGERNSSLGDARDSAKSSYRALSEWLANNGFSNEGYTAKKEKDELMQGLKELLGRINREYRYQAFNTQERYFG